MKRLILLSSIILTLSISAQTVEKIYYFDFGGQGSRGTLSTAPGWNNITTAAEADQSIKQFVSYDLKDSNDQSDGYKLVLTTDWGANGNTGGGGLYNPDPEQLGDLALETATVDYIFNTNTGESGRSFVISGLDTDKGYKFTIFGSRSANEVRRGNFILSGYNSWMTDMQVAGSGIGKNGENYRTGDPLSSGILFPDAAGNITLWIENPNNTYVPLSCMKMEQYYDAEKPELKGSVTETYFLDFGSEIANRGASTTESGWNNILANSGNDCTAGTVFSNLVNSKGETTNLELSVDSKYTTNGYSTGLGLPAPSPEALGDLAIETATYDYFFVDQAVASGQMTFKGLNPNRSYRFYSFASRKAADARLGAYRFEGLNSWTGAMQAAGNSLDNTSSQNSSVILISDPIFPDAAGEITLTMINGQKIYLPINCMKIEELGGVERPNIVSVVSAVLEGEGVDAGEITEFANRGKNVFELYLKSQGGQFSVKGTDDADETVTLPVTLSEGINRITVNFNTNEVEVLPVTYLCVEGSAVGGWNVTGKELTYQGKGVWTFKGDLDGYDTSTDSGRVNFIMNKDWGHTFKRVSGSRYELAEGSGDDIPLNPGTYDITLDLNNMTWEIANGLDELDPYRVTVMGSSVANGQGATADSNNTNMGYAYSYNKALAERYENGESENPFYISNISIGGNSSINLLNRFDDLERDYGKWVIYGISLGNEGIHGASNQEAIYNQWKTNMQTLISQARELGKEVVVMNNYTRGDFVDSDYEYVKKINDEIAFWDVPSVNMLGAIDNGKGNWADGYQNGDDVYHPNTAGHDEFFYAMVPSMMDAMLDGKTLTMKRTVTDGYTLPTNTTVEFTPDGTVHSFTLAVSAKAADGDVIAAIAVDGEETPVTITRQKGEIVATLPDHTELSVAATADLDEIELSQNYIRKMISLTVNGQTYSTTDFEAVTPVSVVLGDAEAENGITLGEVMFYRSSMHTSSPFTSDGQLNKSSLEVYAPMNESPENEAMSTVAVNVKTVSDGNGNNDDDEDGEKEDSGNKQDPADDNKDQGNGSGNGEGTGNGTDKEEDSTNQPSTGIETVENGNNSFRVECTAPGTLTGYSSNPVVLNLFTMTGQKVRTLNVECEFEINGLVPGIYIANGTKIMVK